MGPLVRRILPLLIIGVAACAREDPAPKPAAPSDAATAGVLRIVATDAGFDAPDRVPAGLRHVVYENRGSQIHEAMLVRLAPGMKARDYVSAVEGGVLFPKGAHDYSGPGLTSPGGTAELWLELDPGAYIIICWFGDHSETQPVHELTVAAERRDDAPPPAPDAIVRLIDFRVDVEGELRAGPQLLRIETVGPSMHELDFYRLDEGRTLADLMSWHKQDQQGTAPGTAVTGILDSHDVTRIVWLRSDFAPGRYVLWCTMPMSTDPAAPKVDVSHADAGMIREIVIAE